MYALWLMKNYALFLVLLLFTSGYSEEVYDVVVYGGTSAGVIAAVQAAKMGKSVVLIESSQHIGGMTSSGLGKIDTKNVDILGGLTRNYFHRVWKYYQHPQNWIWEKQPKSPPHQEMYVVEPHVAEKLFKQMAKEVSLRIELGERLNRKNGVHKEGGRIVEIAMESGRKFQGKMFIDATYVGDLMAAAGVSYTVGREPNSHYHETLNGIHPYIQRALSPGIDPYVVKGDPKSGLLPRIHPNAGGNPGDGDRGVQAYNFRLCLTKVAANRIPIEKPIQYKDSDYELIFRVLEASIPAYKIGILSNTIPNGKIDLNNSGLFSTDFVGMSWNYAEADYAEREKITLEHENWQRGLLWTLQNHPRISSKVHAFFAHWGLAKDEFPENHHWPYQLYVRESRRMVSDAVVTENTVRGKDPPIDDSIGLGAYPMDSHIVKYYVAPDGLIACDGTYYVGAAEPYRISYRAIVPKASECENLLVPVCLSASHAAYGSVRIESTFMLLAQSAATAACLAIDCAVPVQKVPYETLRHHLLAEGQVLKWPR